MIARKNPILEIAENKINEIFTAQRYELNTHFMVIAFNFIDGIFLPSFIFIVQKLRFKFICDLFEIKHTELFLFLYICNTPKF